MNGRSRRFNAKTIPPEFLSELETADSGERFPVIVGFVSLNERAKTITPAVTGAKNFRLTPTTALTVTAADIAEISQLPGCRQVWPDIQLHTCLDQSVPLVGAPAIWEQGYTGRDIRIAVIDTGVDVDHPDLAERVAATFDVTREGFSDRNGHGTHVAGIAVGTGPVYRGIAPGASILGVKVLRGNGFGQMSWVMEGVEWAIEKQAHIINLSLGSSGSSDGTDPLSATCDAAVEQGFVVCAAAGNEGPRSGSIGTPGGARRVITVGASTDSDAAADFSSRGPTSDGRVKPDLLFPGHNIIAARAQGTSMGQTIDQRYTQVSGTSMATPHASGAAALMLEANPDLRPGDIKALLMQTAKNLGLPPTVQGKGRARIDQAFGRDPETVPHPDPLPLPVPPGWPDRDRLQGCLRLIGQLMGARR